MRNSKFPVILAAVAIVATGCYGYYPPTTTNLTGHPVQLLFTDAGAVALAPRLGPGVESVSGTLLADSADSYRIAVFGSLRRDGQESGWRGEPVDIPHSYVTTLSEKRFSRARTALFTTLTSIALVATKAAFGGIGGSNAPGPTPTGPPGGK